jgi:hypothetical protein
VPEISNILVVDGKILIVSLFFLRRQHQLARWKPRLLSLSAVRILPIVVVHKKKGIRGRGDLEKG